MKHANFGLKKLKSIAWKTTLVLMEKKLRTLLAITRFVRNNKFRVIEKTTLLPLSIFDF